MYASLQHSSTTNINAMSWRSNTGQTGANTIPLGPRRRFGDEDGGPPVDEPPPPPRDMKRGRSPERKAPELNPDGTKKRRKRNRWGDAADNKAAGLMNLPTAITGHMTTEQKEAYVTHLRIEEISQKLRINDVVPADGDRYVHGATRATHADGADLYHRSPSPPPQYDNFGRRVNTREYRYRKRLEDERHKLIEKAMKIIPSYHPPSDYRRPTKTQEKVYVPVNDYPEINFSMLSSPLTLLTFLSKQFMLLHNMFTTIKSRTNPPRLTHHTLLA
jgi:splicing factor 1